MSSSAFSTSIVSTSRASSSTLRHRNQSSSFIHDSYNASLDFPTYIPWQTLSTDVMQELRQGSVKINRSNKVEWADTIKEEAEKTPLLDRRKLASGSQGSEESNVSDAVSGGKHNSFILILKILHREPILILLVLSKLLWQQLLIGQCLNQRHF